MVTGRERERERENRKKKKMGGFPNHRAEKGKEEGIFVLPAPKIVDGVRSFCSSDSKDRRNPLNLRKSSDLPSKKSPPLPVFCPIFDPFLGAEDRRCEVFDLRGRRSKIEDGSFYDLRRLTSKIVKRGFFHLRRRKIEESRSIFDLRSRKMEEPLSIFDLRS